MKTTLTLFFIAIISFSVYGQKDSCFFFNEFSISVNKPYYEYKQDMTKDNLKIGFGCGAYHSIRLYQWIDMNIGLEFNKTTYFSNYAFGGHFIYRTDITSSYYSFGIPVTYRLSIGKKIRGFIDYGGSIEYVYYTEKGNSFYSGPDTTITSEKSEYSYSGFVYPRIRFGVSLGGGFIYAINKKEIIIKVDYKYGLKPFDFYYSNYSNRYFRLIVGLRI